MRERVWLALVLIAAAGLRAFGLGAFPYEQDELYTIHEATRLFDSQLQPGIEGRPFYYLLQHAVLTVWPASPLSLRVLPFVFGLLGVWITWRLARSTAGPIAGLAAAALVAISPWHLHASGFARYYSLVYALAAAAIYLLWRAYETNRPRDYLIALAILLLGTATHPSFVFPLIGVGAGLSVIQWRDGAVRWAWPTAVAWRFLWIPLVAAVIAGWLALRLTGHGGAFQNWGGRGSAAMLRLVPAIVQWMTPTVFAAALAGTLTLLAGRESRRRAFAVCVVLGMATTLGLLLIAGQRTSVYADYAIGMLPLVFVAAGAFVQRIAEGTTEGARLLTGGVAVVLMAGILPSTVSHLQDGTRFDYRPAFERIARAGPSLAVLTEPLVLARAYAPELRAYPLRRRAAALDSALTIERALWTIVSFQRYGISGGGDEILEPWLARHCRLDHRYERPRLDYRVYRVELYRCEAES
jgi:uncharacterized membrane protein